MVFLVNRPNPVRISIYLLGKSPKNSDISKEVIAIDSKEVKEAKDVFYNTKTAHLVSAWVNSNQLVLGQVKVEDKSNEITAIPILLDVLDIEGCTINIDAMGTQRKIAAQIIEKKQIIFWL